MDRAHAEMKAIDQSLGEVPLPAQVTLRDVQVAVRVVVVHAPQRWPDATLCRNDRAPYPCRLARWGRRVLEVRGFSVADVDALIDRGDPLAEAALRLAGEERR